MRHEWSWKMDRAGVIFQMPTEGRIIVQEGPQPDEELRKAISELCKQFFANYTQEKEHK